MEHDSLRSAVMTYTRKRSRVLGDSDVNLQLKSTK